MNGKRTLVITLALLALLVTSGWAATLEVSQPVQVTSDSYYERGQAIVYDGSDYWLFYGRSASCTVPYSGGDPDLHDYVTYYKKASTVAGLAAASPASVTGTHNADSYLGETGAVVYGSDVWVFATIDGDGVHTPAADCDLYGWWSNDGGSAWSEVGPIISGIGDGQAHHDEVVFDGKLWVLEGTSNFTTMHSTTPKTGGWSTPITVGTATGGLGHFFVDGTDLYLALGSAGTYYIYKYNSGTVAWALIDSKAISGYYDPTLYKVGSDYVFHCAPYAGGRQWIVGWIGSTLDGSFFDGTELDVVEGRYGSNVWTDMWPIGFTDNGGTSYLFYTSERDVPSAEGVGNIWYLEVDWTVSNDHYTYVQEAIDSASPGGTINVGAGTYTENFDVNKRVLIVGAGSGSDPASNTVITQDTAGSGDTKVGVAQLSASGASAADPILLQDLRLEPVGMAGISVGRFCEATGTTVSYVKLDNVYVIGTNVNPSTEQERGLYVDLTSSLYHLDVDDCAFDNLTYGWYTQKEISADASTVQYVTVDNTTFNHNNHKGVYCEKLSDATFTGCTVDQNGYDSSVLPSYFQAWSCGLDVNLKAGTYANIAFVECIVTANAIDEAMEGVGVTVKARDDGATYGPYPATVDNVDVISCTITGNERGLRFGEPSKDNATPTNVTVEDCVLHSNTQHYSGGDGSAYGELINMTASGNVVDASLNWWGDLDPSDQISGEVDYSPWYAAVPGTSPMPIGTDDSIQAAIDAAGAGATISVSAGEYVEQLHITTNGLTIAGAGDDVVTIKSPATLPLFFGTNYPIVFIDGATGVDISGVTIDGDGQGNANYRFIGLAFWNGGGSLLDARVTGVMDTPFSGAQHGVGIYAYNDTGGPYTVVLTDVVVDEFQKNALALSGDGLTVDIDRLNCIGQGPTTVTAQNGIQIGFGAGGTVDDCVVSDVYYTPTDWSATGALMYLGGSVDMTGVTAERCEVGVDFYDTDGSFVDGAIVDPYLDGLYVDVSASTRSDGRSTAVSPFVEDYTPGGRASHAVTVSGSRFIGEGVTDSWGVSTYAEGAATLTVTGCTVSNWDWGIVAYEDGGTAASTVNGNGIYGNTSYGFYTNATAKATQDATGNWWGHTSGPHHPTANPSAAGDPVSDGVDFDPWLGGNIVCDPDPLDLVDGSPTGTIDVDYLGGGDGLLFGYSVTVTWDITKATLTGITQGNLLSDAGGTNFFAYGPAGAKTIDCALTGGSAGVTGPGTLFTLAFSAAGLGTSTVVLDPVAFRDNANVPLSGFYVDDGVINVDTTTPVFTDVSLWNLTLTHTDDYAKNGDNLELTANVTDTPLLTVLDIVADFSTLLVGGVAGVPAETYDGVVATWTTALAGVILTADGSPSVTVTATDWLGNSAGGSDAITVDNTPPGTVAGLAAGPAHKEVVLSWDDASGEDTNYYGVLVQYNVWGDYADYATSAPAYPGDYTAGVQAFSGVGTGTTLGVVPRDIYYFSAFVYDWALNYGTVVTAGQDRSTNYWLGDVAFASGVWGYNGLVNVHDIDKLGGNYGSAPPDGVPGYEECDVGPTDDHSRVGIPEPDNMISFEDLMIFAMNYNVVSAKVVPFLGEPVVGDLALALVENGRTNGGMVELALRLEGNLGDVKGLTAEFEFEGLEFLSARLSDEMSVPVADVFFWSNATSHGVQVDAAVLGTDVTIGGSGDVAVLTFQVLDETYSVDFVSAQLRDVANEDLTAELEGLSSDLVPVAFKLVQNSPNPFNPVTKVAYHVPSESRVTIRVFDVTGRLVTTLVDGVVEAGRHAAVWNGTNDRGESVGSGVYFCTMETPDYSSSHKMTLLK